MSIEAVARRILVDGISGEQAMTELKQTYKTLSSLNSASSRVRTMILESGQRCPEYDDSELRGFQSAEIDAFLGMPLKEQYRLQREHRSKPSWGEIEEDALARLQILPFAMEEFRLSKRETNQLKRDREQAQITKNERLVVIAEPAKLLQAATSLLRHATTEYSFAKLILPLLLVSGRRLTEIVNTKSTFDPISDAPHCWTHYCMFGGQLKKKRAAAPFRIPLLVPLDLFASALKVLRDKQGIEMANVTNMQAKNRYQGNTQRDLSKGVLPGMPRECHIHDLRSTYMAMVYALYVSPWTFARTAMGCLGHETLMESMSYNNVRLEAVEGMCGSLGELQL